MRYFHPCINYTWMSVWCWTSWKVWPSNDQSEFFREDYADNKSKEFQNDWKQNSSSKNNIPLSNVSSGCIEDKGWWVKMIILQFYAKLQGFPPTDLKHTRVVHWLFFHVHMSESTNDYVSHLSLCGNVMDWYHRPGWNPLLTQSLQKVGTSSLWPWAGTSG